ncbi:MAG: integrase family protein [Thiolinea sp.]
MTTNKLNLTNTKAYSLPVPDTGQAFYWDAKQAGLGLRITSAGARSWIAQGYVNGKSKRFTLGLLDDLDYKEAREEAGKVRGQMRKGINPLTEKRKRNKASEAETVTLREIMEEYIKHKTLRPATKRDIIRVVENDFTKWADKPIANITRDAVAKRFRELSKASPTRANLAFRNLRALINSAREKYCTADGIYTIFPLNPVTQAFKLADTNWNPETKRRTRIPEDKIGEVWLILEQHANSDHNRASTCISADLIAFMLLTGCRIGEANQLTWDRVDLDSTLPSFHLAVTKNHNPITLPINDALHSVLTRRYEARVNDNPYVFPAVRGKCGYMKDPRAMMQHVAEVSGCKVTPHDLRRTFEDIATKVGVDSDRRRILLNHITGDVHSAHYANNLELNVLMPEAQKISNWIVCQANMTIS